MNYQERREALGKINRLARELSDTVELFGDGNITNKMAIAVDLAINNHDRLVGEVTTKDEQIKNLVGILELCVSGMNEAMIMEGLDFYDELHAASELLSKIKDTKL
jgi:hypothetical protein